MKSWLRPLACGALALALVTAAASGSTSYIWCVPMAKAVTSCCCPASVLDQGLLTPAANAIERTCCESRQGRNLVAPSIARLEPTSFPAATWVAVPRPTLTAFDAPVGLRLLSSHPARAGPPAPRIPQYLRNQIFLI